MTYLTTILNKSHKKDLFSCGHLLLDTYLHKQAGQDYKRRLATCFVLVGEDQRVTGYYTLSSAAINRENLPEEIKAKLPPSYESLPATLLGRLARDETIKGKGFGEHLLIDALKRSYDIASSSLGSMAVIVDPIDEKAAKFYSKYGFINLPDSGKMFLPMRTIESLFKI